MAQYVALLRGINVGGNNLIKMTALAACLEAGGLEDVATYIQSGNVVFTAPGAGAKALVRRVEDLLEAAFRVPISVVLRTHAQLRAVVERAPRGFGAAPAKHRYDVVFLKEPLSAATAMKSVLIREGVDEAHPGVGVLYFSRLVARLTQSRLNKIASSPIYPQVTIRNWNTTTRLLGIMDARADRAD
jgi:uncharacterized protein (DUF1697 family)